MGKAIKSKRSRKGQPTWDIARLFPLQGQRSEEEYLALDTNHLIELIDGRLEMPPMPAAYHQFILTFLLEVLSEYVRRHKLDKAAPVPLPIRLWPSHLREPDIVFFRWERLKDLHKPQDGADLVMEIVSPGKENRKRDLLDKRHDYAKARIPEYWIIDPDKELVAVLVLEGPSYRVHGEFKRGTMATSVFLPGFAVDVNEVLSAGESAEATNGQARRPKRKR